MAIRSAASEPCLCQIQEDDIGCNRKGYHQKESLHWRFDKERLRAVEKGHTHSGRITKLVATHYAKENPDIRRAFIFCLYCGLRWSDVKDLTYANVDYSNKLLKFEQNKTKAHSAASRVVIPLND